MTHLPPPSRRPPSRALALALALAGIPLAVTQPVAAAAGAGPASGSGPAAAETRPGGGTTDRALASAFQPLPKVLGTPEQTTEARVELGRMLFHDTRLSRSQQVSCNSCHTLDRWGVDNEPTSLGHKGQRGGRNSPTALNAAGHFVQFWDGRAQDVEAQAKGPVLNPVEMAMPDAAAVEATLRSIPGYQPLFAKAFPNAAEPVTFDNAANAIGAFERTLVTPSRFDAYLEGDDGALTAEEKRGLTLFVQTGCPTCHAGPFLGGHIYQKAGLVKPWPNQKDQGRYEVTKNDADRMTFKVPGLRNVAKTGPYFHDGSVANLEEAVKLMARHQLGRELSDADARTIVVFLGSLTGDVPAGMRAVPALPPSGPDTPKPDPS